MPLSSCDITFDAVCGVQMDFSSLGILTKTCLSQLHKKQLLRSCSTLLDPFQDFKISFSDIVHANQGVYANVPGTFIESLLCYMPKDAFKACQIMYGGRAEGGK